MTNFTNVSEHNLEESMRWVTKVHLGGPKWSITIVKSFGHFGVAPVLDHIVGAIMNLNFNCVASVIDEENDATLFVANHGA